jgi:hypothetical protein
VGFLGTVIAFERAVVDGAQAPECRVDRDGDETATAHHFTAPGDDAPPLTGDLAYLGDDAGAGAAHAVGYQDPATAGVAAGGERRIYSRSGPGVVAAEVWLKADGTIIARGVAAGAVLELGPDGSGRVGNALGELAVDAVGNVTWTTALGTNGAATHSHSTPFGPSGPPIPGT